MKLRFSSLLLVWGTMLTLSPLPALGRSEGAIQKTWDFPEGVRTLVIDTDRQDVLLKTGSTRLSGRLVGDVGDVANANQSGDAVTITVKTDRDWWSWRQKTSRVEVFLPPGISVEVTTSSGAVLVQTQTAELRVRSASGDIEAARGGSSIDVDSASGTVRLKGFTGPVKASALSGDLLLEDLSGEIRAATLSGSLKGTGLSPANGSRFSSVSGQVDLRLSGEISDYAVQAETVSGEVQVGDQSSRHTLTVGKGPLVTVKSVNGDVRVR